MTAVSAIVYLAEGSECRCLRLSGTATVQDIVDKMLELQEDWDDMGKSTGSRQFKESDTKADSSTDEGRLQYGILSVADPGNGGPCVESILPREARILSNRFRDIRSTWAKTVLRQMSARFTNHAHQSSEKKSLSSSSSSPSKKKAPKQKTFKSEYWFVESAKPRKEQNVRIKFVNLDQYDVAKKKEGWLNIKTKKGTSAFWSVLEEGQFRYYSEATEDKPPVSVIENVESCLIDVKPPKKGIHPIEIKHQKQKTILLCENDVMCDKWHTALRRGKSGAIKEHTPTSGIKLKFGSPVEEIPEYTEEEENADEGTGGVVVDSSYLSLSQMQRLVDPDGGYMSLCSQLTKAGDGDGGYMDTLEIEEMLINSAGQYLTIDALRRVVRDAGFSPSAHIDYISVEQLQALDTGYTDIEQLKSAMKHVEEAQYLELSRSDDGGYMSVQQKGTSDGGYMSVQTKQPDGGYMAIKHQASKDSGYMQVKTKNSSSTSSSTNQQQHRHHQPQQQQHGGDGGYISVNSTSTSNSNSKSKHSTTPKPKPTLHVPSSLSGQAVYISLADVVKGGETLVETSFVSQKQMREATRLQSTGGDYLTIEHARMLLREAGYMSITELGAS